MRMRRINDSKIYEMISAVLVIIGIINVSAITTCKTSSSILLPYQSKHSSKLFRKDGLLSSLTSTALKSSPLVTGISLDQPVLPVNKNMFNNCKSVLTTILLSDVCKATMIAFVFAFGISMLTRLTTTTSLFHTMSNTIQSFFNTIRHKFITYKSYIMNVKQSSMPMSFANNQYGVCTLHSRQSINNQFIQYKFALPNQHTYVPLHLGQGLVFSLLDNNDNVVTADFYLSSPRYANGYLSIILPNVQNHQNHYLFGSKDRFDMARVLQTQIQIGDEIAIKPSNKNTFTYNGPYLPITDIVYVTSHLGILPILQMLQVILPKSNTNTVKSVSIIWINDDLSHFEIAYAELEKFYYKYSKILDVSCIFMHDLTARTTFKNDNRSNTDTSFKEMEDAIPIFSKGTMGVISGPAEFVKKMEKYLQFEKGYPDNCLSLLP